MAVRRFQYDYEFQPTTLGVGGGALYASYVGSPGYGTTQGELGFLENLILSERAAVAGGADYRQVAFANDLAIYDYQRNVQYADDIQVTAPVFATPQEIAAAATSNVNVYTGGIYGELDFVGITSPGSNISSSLGSTISSAASRALAGRSRTEKLASSLIYGANPIRSLADLPRGDVAGAVSGTLTPNLRRTILESYGGGIRQADGSLTPPPVTGLSYFDSGMQEALFLTAGQIDGGGIVRGGRAAVAAADPARQAGEYAQRQAFYSERDIAESFGMLGNVGLAKVRGLQQDLGLPITQAVAAVREEFGLSPEFRMGGRTYGISGQERVRRADVELYGQSKRADTLTFDYRKAQQAITKIEQEMAGQAYGQDKYLKTLGLSTEYQTPTAFGFGVERETRYQDYPSFASRFSDLGGSNIGAQAFLEVAFGLEDVGAPDAPGYAFSPGSFVAGQPVDSAYTRGGQTEALGLTKTQQIDVPDIDTGALFTEDFRRLTGVDKAVPVFAPQTVKPIATQIARGDQPAVYEYPGYIGKQTVPGGTVRYQDLYEPISGTGSEFRPPDLRLNTKGLARNKSIRSINVRMTLDPSPY